MKKVLILFLMMFFSLAMFAKTGLPPIVNNDKAKISKVEKMLLPASCVLHSVAYDASGSIYFDMTIYYDCETGIRTYGYNNLTNEIFTWFLDE